MGIALALKCEGMPKLSIQARIVLVTMALHALDTPTDDNPAAVYWGGWPRLAFALGYPLYDPTAKRAVARAVAELIAEGCVRVEDRGTQNLAVYRLLI